MSLEPSLSIYMKIDNGVIKLLETVQNPPEFFDCLINFDFMLFDLLKTLLIEIGNCVVNC